MTRPGIRYRPVALYHPGTAGPGRAVHLVDAENLLGTATPLAADVAQLAACYARRVGFEPMDQVVIACSHRAFTTIGFCWRGPQYLLRSGPDGADLALLAVLRHDRIAARFPRVIIASGDHIFTPGRHRPGRGRLPGHRRQPPRPPRPHPRTRGARPDRLPRPARPGARREARRPSSRQLRRKLQGGGGHAGSPGWRSHR